MVYVCVYFLVFIFMEQLTGVFELYYTHKDQDVTLPLCFHFP
jgi:hypothetical protein